MLRTSKAGEREREREKATETEEQASNMASRSEVDEGKKQRYELLAGAKRAQSPCSPVASLQHRFDGESVEA
jgi:hypothetical protein